MAAPSNKSESAWDRGESAEVEALLRRARAGEREALDELCRRFYPDVQRRVHSALDRDVRRGRPWLAALFSTSDILHDVLLGVLRDMGVFRGNSRAEFVIYLSRLTRNRILDAIRYHEAARRDGRRTERADAFEKECESDSPDDLLIRREQVEHAYTVLESFPERDRALLRGRIEDGEDYRTLAEELGYASADAARKAFHYVRARLVLRMRKPDERP